MEIGDVIDIKLWTRIQEKFAEVIELPVLTIDREGNEVVTAQKLPFFLELIRHKDPESFKECRKKHLEELMNEKKDVLFYTCHCGLLSVMVPIKVNNECIGAVLCESIRKKEEGNVRLCQRIGNKINVAPIELIDALKKIKIVNREKIIQYGTLLHILSSTIPRIAAEKKQDIKKISELEILQNIGQKLNSGLEFRPIIDYILNLFEKELEFKTSIILLEDKEKKKYSLENSEINRDEKHDFNELILKNNIIFEESEGTHKMLIPLKEESDLFGMIRILAKESIEHLIHFFSVVGTQTSLALKNAKQYEQIRQLAIRDKLTGLFNRREFTKRFKEELVRTKRFLTPLSLIMLDLDDFKKYNDTFGHTEGDVLLKKTGKILKDCVREVDIVARYGGEEFIIILPEADYVAAGNVAERIRQSIEKEEFKRKVTASIGIATSLNTKIKEKEFIDVADSALYEAKNNGKNQIISKRIVEENLKELDEFVNSKV